MGGFCGKANSHKQKGDTQEKNLEAQTNYNEVRQHKTEIKTIKDWNITNVDFVHQKFGKITDEYKLIEPALGKGAFGSVHKAIHIPSNITRAIKIINKDTFPKNEQDKLIDEVNILKKLDHPNIIKILEFYQDEEYFWIISELYTGGELFDKIINEKKLDEIKTANIMKQILSAVFYCHQNKIVHRDLKPENILFESNKENSSLKVIDFGTSRQFDPNQKMKQKFGTPYYIAPEVLKYKYDEKCDIWSAGVILYIMLCGYPPFNGNSDKQIMEKVKKGEFSLESDGWDKVSKEAKGLIKKMLEYDPEKRVSAEQAINDPWIVKFSKKQDVNLPQMQQVLTNMKNFRINSKLQEASYLFIINFLATKEEKNELLKIFQSLDQNGDGVLSKDELIQGYQKLMDKDQAKKIVENIMEIIDKNGNGTIDYTEFVMATINRKNMLSQQRLETVFKIIDKDGSGKLEMLELKQIFGGENNISDEVWQQIIKEVDENNDGEISYKEFKTMMLNLIDKQQ